MSTYAAPDKLLLLTTKEEATIPTIEKLTGMDKSTLDQLPEEYEDERPQETFVEVIDPELDLTYHYFINVPSEGNVELVHYGVNTPFSYLVAEVNYFEDTPFTNVRLTKVVRNLLENLEVFELPEYAQDTSRPTKEVLTTLANN